MIKTFLQKMMDSNTPGQWLGGLALFLAGLALLSALKYLLGGKSLAKRKEIEFSGWRVIRTLFHKVNWLAIIVLSLNLSRFSITLPAEAVSILEIFNRIVFIYQIGGWLDAALGLWVQVQVSRQDKDPEPSRRDSASVRLVGTIGRVFLWLLIGLLLLDNIPGIEINSLIASLGVSGIAVALAVQSLLGDLLASITIAIDKPFVTGDFIKAGDQSGTIEKIGLRSTHLRAFTGELLVVSNQKLLDAWVNNYQDMSNRRITFTLRVPYDAGFSALNQIPDIMNEIFSAYEPLTLERVTFKAYTDSALLYEIVYLVTTSDFDTYINLRHCLNLDIYQRFEAAGIRFALPEQKVNIKNEQGT